MIRIFARAGIDYVQWKAVSKTLLRADFRAPTPQTHESYSLRSALGLLRMALVFGLFGFATALLIAVNHDILLTGTLTLVYLTFALSTALLTQHGSTMLAAADVVILGPRPVSSRTFFAIRLTNVLFHTLLITTFVAYPPILAFTFAHGVSLLRGAAAAVAIYAWAIAVACVVVTAYTAMLRLVGGQRLQRIVGYMQMIVGVFAYGGYFVATQTLRAPLQRATLPESIWLLLLPPAWFVSYIQIAVGQTTAAIWTRATLSLVLLVTLALLLRGRLATSYAGALAQPQAQAAPAQATKQRLPRLFKYGEARAVVLLCAAHIKHDLRVRMGLFAVVPLILIYVLSGLRRSGNADPFVGGTADQGLNLLALSALMFPAIVMQHLGSSDAYRAAWIYSATPADHGRLVVALKNVATVFLLLPFLLILTVLLAWRFGDPIHAVTHAALLVSVSHVALQMSVLLNPKLPFAAPPDKSGGTSMLVWIVGVLLGGQLLLVVVQSYVYPSWPRIGAFFVCLIALSWLLENVIRRGSSATRLRRAFGPGV